MRKLCHGYQGPALRWDGVRGWLHITYLFLCRWSWLLFSDFLSVWSGSCCGRFRAGSAPLEILDSCIGLVFCSLSTQNSGQLSEGVLAKQTGCFCFLTGAMDRPTKASSSQEAALGSGGGEVWGWPPGPSDVCPAPTLCLGRPPLTAVCSPSPFFVLPSSTQGAFLQQLWLVYLLCVRNYPPPRGEATKMTATNP